jgi:CRP-like cAMP-binding protein
MGSFEVHVKAVGEKKSTKIEGIVLNDGEGFGELALMYSKPRAATIIAAEDSIVWSLEREDYHNITTYFHMKRLKENIDMLGTVEIVPGKRLKDVCTPHELDHMAMCLEKDAFKEGDVIMRQATPGETLFIVQSGKVGCYKSSAVKNMRSSMKMLYEMGSQVGMEVGIEGYAHNTVDIRTTVASEESLVARFGEFQKCMGVGDFFGERGLLEEDVREVSCVAQEDCVLLTLDRDVIEDTIGKMSDIIKGTHNLDEVDDVNFEKEKDLAEKLVVNLTIDDLELITVLGAGAFGKVVLAKHKQTQRCFALKCQAKEMIIQQRLQEHVMHEIHIMSQFCHPNIGMIHTVVQDTRYLYFVLELLQGGEVRHGMTRHGTIGARPSLHCTNTTSFCSLPPSRSSSRTLRSTTSWMR